MITSTGNGRIKYIIQLREKAKLRRKEGKFVSEGCKMFLEAPMDRILETYVSESFLRKATQKGSLEEECLKKMRSGAYEVVADDIFRKVSDTVTPQGILNVIRVKEATLESMVQKEKPLLMILENVQDPGNLGTILRTAEGAGVDGIIMSKDTVDIYNPKVIRSTMGSIYRVPFFYTENLLSVIKQLKQKKIKVYAAHLDASCCYDETDYTEAIAFLIGNEGNGLLEETAQAADVRCVLPMEGQVESLNASVAAAILMYEAYRQRRKK